MYVLYTICYMASGFTVLYGGSLEEYGAIRAGVDGVV